MAAVSTNDEHYAYEARRLIAIASNALSEARANVDGIEYQPLRNDLKRLMVAATHAGEEKPA